MMRVSPLGIFGARHTLEQVAEWARQDAAITHIHPICGQANALFAMAIAYAIREGCGAQSLYDHILAWARDMRVDDRLLNTVQAAAEAPPSDFVSQAGWVLIAFQNALWQLLQSQNLEEAVVDTVMRGGDTDTNAAIAGALLGAFWGIGSIPRQWTEALLNCRPQEGEWHVFHPRPQQFWPVDALELAGQLLGA